MTETPAKTISFTAVLGPERIDMNVMPENISVSDFLVLKGMIDHYLDLAFKKLVLASEAVGKPVL